MKVLSQRGYNIRKDLLSSLELEAIKNDLTVSPYNPNFQNTKSFKLYMESENKIYMPKYYGLQRFGLPEKTKLDGGRSDVQFKGVLRAEQLAPIHNFLEAAEDPVRGGGILNIFCGGGKTVMAIYLISRIKKKTMIIVHKDFLLNQWKDRIEEFTNGTRVGLIKGKIVDVRDKDIVLASLQSISMKDYPEEVFKDIGFLIVDECHHTSAEVFSQALQKLNCQYTLGLSATVTRKDGLSKVFKWYLGDIIYKASKRKDVVDVIVEEYYDTSLEYSREHTLGLNKPNISRMINNICSFQPRNKQIVDSIVTLLQKEPMRKILVLSDRRSHLEQLHIMLNDVKLDCGLYYGGLSKEVLAASESKQIILATYAIASEGYDQKGLDTLVLASPKSDITQSVGRILRDKECDRKHTPVVIDFIDMFSIFEKQGDKRLKFYTSHKYKVDHRKLYNTIDPKSFTGACLLD